MWLSSHLKTLHLKMVHLNHPTAYVQQGRISQILVKQQQKIWFANCAFMHETLQAVCQQSPNKTQFNMLHANLQFFTRSTWNYAQTKKQVFVQTLVIQDAKTSNIMQLSNPSQQDLQQWQSATSLPIYLLRFFILCNFLGLTLLFLQNFRLKPQIL
ncbi:hypothetical protein [Acinetobacter sp. ANC 4169]|uniref:hypothetical protein n=1 Tax=Acinetobacter sp. ANC 4169 TaxID=1977879 RepID=UPI00117743AE|nr:hypothetical protein [Acinetobacter sp. ANC 4169]